MVRSGFHRIPFHSGSKSPVAQTNSWKVTNYRLSATLTLARDRQHPSRCCLSPSRGWFVIPSSFSFFGPLQNPSGLCHSFEVMSSETKIGWTGEVCRQHSLISEEIPLPACNVKTTPGTLNQKVCQENGRTSTGARITTSAFSSRNAHSQANVLREGAFPAKPKPDMIGIRA